MTTADNSDSVALAQPEPPRRRLRMTLDLHADDWEALGNALHDIATRVEIEHTRKSTSGGSSDGYSFEVTEDSAITHDSYFAALTEWRAALRRGAATP